MAKECGDGGARGHVGLDRSYKTPVMVSHVGFLSMWKWQGSPPFSRMYGWELILRSSPHAWAQVALRGSTKWVPDSGQLPLPSRCLSQTMESLRGGLQDMVGPRGLSLWEGGSPGFTPHAASAAFLCPLN